MTSRVGWSYIQIDFNYVFRMEQTCHFAQLIKHSAELSDCISPLNGQDHVILVVRFLVFRLSLSYDHSESVLLIVKRVDKITSISGSRFLMGLWW